MSGSSTKPYLLRAIHEWCADNGFTPYLAVAVDEHTEVPREHVREGEIVLNISVSATNRLALGNERIEFQARFGGVARSISVPIENVTAIYARETGHGMAFEVAKPPAIVESHNHRQVEAAQVEAPKVDSDSEPPGPKSAQRVSLVVPPAPQDSGELAVDVETGPADTSGTDHDPGPPSGAGPVPAKGRPSLKVVK